MKIVVGALSFICASETMIWMMHRSWMEALTLMRQWRRWRTMDAIVVDFTYVIRIDHLFNSKYTTQDLTIANNS